MDGGMLSQEEINALMGGDADNTLQDLTDTEKDAVGEISNISMGTAATALSTLVNKRVTITTPVVSFSSWDDLVDDYDKPCVFIQISYKEGLDGNNILILRERDVKIITDLMMGGDGSNTNDELSELHLSAISEAMNQMMGSAATSLSSMLEKKVDISPPSATLIDLNDDVDTEELAPFLRKSFIKVSFKMEIEGLVDSEIMQLYPLDFAKNLYDKFMNSSSNSSSSNTNENEVKKEEQVSQPQQNTQQMQNQMSGMPQGQMGQMPPYGMPQGQMPYGEMPQGQMGQMPPYGMPYMMQPDVNIQQVQFQPFNQPTILPPNAPENIDLIMDVPLEVTVELGRTNKSIKEILDFAPGTIIELNKIAGEPIDVLVNGKFVAKGEVVVIEENYGIRVTDMIK